MASGQLAAVVGRLRPPSDSSGTWRGRRAAGVFTRRKSHSERSSLLAAFDLRSGHCTGLGLRSDQVAFTTAGGDSLTICIRRADGRISDSAIGDRRWRGRRQSDRQFHRELRACCFVRLPIRGSSAKLALRAFTPLPIQPLPDTICRERESYSEFTNGRSVGGIFLDFRADRDCDFVDDALRLATNSWQN